MRQGRTLAANPRSTLHTSPGLGLGILGLQGIKHQEAIIRSPVTIGQRLRIRFHLKQAPDNLPSVTVIQPGQLG
jgi:hypothetical protein